MIKKQKKRENPEDFQASKKPKKEKKLEIFE